jgi:cyclophilin family peptidyl-prolyl cis-trans isomerase
MKSNIAKTVGILAIALLGFGIYAIWNAASAPPASNTFPYNNAESPQPQAQTPPSAPEVPPTNQTQSNIKHMITIKTTLGDIQFETYDSDAPKAVNNFITLANKGFYNNVIFHRVIPGFMIQGGDPTGTGMGGPGYKFEDELDPTTASYKAGYKKGVVAMANSGPNTNGSQFFIMLADYPLPNNYTIFGKVAKGQEVVDAIGALPRDANDRPLTPPLIKSVIVAGE